MVIDHAIKLGGQWRFQLFLKFLYSDIPETAQSGLSINFALTSVDQHVYIAQWEFNFQTCFG